MCIWYDCSFSQFTEYTENTASLMRPWVCVSAPCFHAESCTTCRIHISIAVFLRFNIHRHKSMSQFDCFFLHLPTYFWFIYPKLLWHSDLYSKFHFEHFAHRRNNIALFRGPRLWQLGNCRHSMVTECVSNTYSLLRLCIHPEPLSDPQQHQNQLKPGPHLGKTHEQLASLPFYKERQNI